MQARIGAGPTSFSHLGRGPLFRSAFSKFHVFLARILRPRFSSLSSACRDDYYAIYIIRIFAAFLIPSGAGNIVTRRSCQRRIKSALIHLRTARDASPKRGTRVIGLDL